VKALKSHDYGKYVGAVMRIEETERTGKTVATLWRKEDDYWKLISTTSIPRSIGARLLTSVRPSRQQSQLTLRKAMKKWPKPPRTFWINGWLKELDKALEFAPPKSFACAEHHRADNVPTPSSPDQLRRLLKKGMTTIAMTTGSVKDLTSAITAPQPHHRSLKLVKHTDDESFVVVSLPESMGDAANCTRRKPIAIPISAAIKRQDTANIMLRGWP
jgi:hypothetical protein